jgi:hypothetical protein
MELLNLRTNKNIVDEKGSNKAKGGKRPAES